MTTSYRSSHQRCFIKGCPQKFRNIHRTTTVLESLFNKVADLQGCNFFKKRLQHRCFPVNCNLFKNSYSEEHLRRTTSVLNQFFRTTSFKRSYFRTVYLIYLFLNFYFTFNSLKTFITLNLKGQSHKNKFCLNFLYEKQSNSGKFWNPLMYVFSYTGSYIVFSYRPYIKIRKQNHV